MTEQGLRTAALLTQLADRALDPAMARSKDAPPAPPGSAWRRFDAAIRALLQRANIAA